MNQAGPAQPGPRDYQLRGWAQTLAWAELVRDQGIQPRAPAMVDELGEECDAPVRDADAIALRPPDAGGGLAAELWIDDNKIIWRRVGFQARRVYDFEPYPFIGWIWPIHGWRLSHWNFAVREAQAIPEAA
jgi:hypothetical protein